MRKENKLNKLLDSEENIDLVLSYSKVSDYDKNGASALLEKTFTQGKGLKLGSLVDDILFNKDKFNDKYYIGQFNEPIATSGILTKIITTNYNEVPTKEVVLEIVKLNNLWGRTKDEDKLISYFDKDDFWGYLEEYYNTKPYCLSFNLQAD